MQFRQHEGISQPGSQPDFVPLQEEKMLRPGLKFRRLLPLQDHSRRLIWARARGPRRGWIIVPDPRPMTGRQRHPGLMRSGGTAPPTMVTTRAVKVAVFVRAGHFTCEYVGAPASKSQTRFEAPGRSSRAPLAAVAALLKMLSPPRREFGAITAPNI